MGKAPVTSADPVGLTPAQQRTAKARAAKALKKQIQGISAQPRQIDIDEESPVVRAGAAPRNTRQPVRQQPARHVEREPERRGAVVVTGRDGEILSRSRTQVGDIYHVEGHEIPDGWDYQWNPYTVLNQQATDSQVLMHANGFRPVPANRHPGRWTQQGATGAIIVNGLRLEERPSTLGDQARAEDIQKARTQMRDQTDSLRLTEKLPTGFESKRKYRGTGGDVRISIDKGIDIPRPSHEFEE